MDIPQRENTAQDTGDDNPFAEASPAFADVEHAALRQEVIDLKIKLANAAKEIDEITERHEREKDNAARETREKEKKMEADLEARLKEGMDAFKESIAQELREEAQRISDEKADLDANQKELENALYNLERTREELLEERRILDGRREELESREDTMGDFEEDLKQKAERQKAREAEFAEDIAQSREEFTTRMAAADRAVEEARKELEDAKRSIVSLRNADRENQKTLLDKAESLARLELLYYEARAHIDQLEEGERARQNRRDPAPPQSPQREDSPMATGEDAPQSGEDTREANEPTNAPQPNATPEHRVPKLEDLLVDPDSPPTLTSFDPKDMPSTALHYNHVLEFVPASVIQSIQDEPLTSLVIHPLLANQDLMEQTDLIQAWTEFFAHFKGHEEIIVAPSKGPRALTVFNVPRDLHTYLCSARAIIHKPLVAGFIYEINNLAANPSPNIAIYTAKSNVVANSTPRQRQFLEIVRNCLSKNEDVKTAIKNISGGTSNYARTRDEILAKLGVEHTTMTQRYGVIKQAYILSLRVQNIPTDMYIALLSAILKCTMRESNVFHYDRTVAPLDCRICSSIGHYGQICPWVLLEDYLGPRPDTDWKTYLGQQLKVAREAVNVGTNEAPEPADDDDRRNTRRQARGGGRPNRNNARGRGGNR